MVENTPEHVDTNQIYSHVFNEAIQEILFGSIEEFNGWIGVKNMKKQCQGNGLNDRVFCAKDENPTWTMYMTQYQIRRFLWHGNVCSLDWQLKRKNTYGRVLCGPAKTNNNNELVHFSYSFMIAELLGISEILLKSMSEISEKETENTMLIAMDGKCEHEAFHKTLPSLTITIFLLYSQDLTHMIFSKTCQSWRTCLYLKIITTSRQKFGLNILAWTTLLLYGHILMVHWIQTKVEFDQHRSDIYRALAERPKDINYFRKYLYQPQSITWNRS